MSRTTCPQHPSRPGGPYAPVLFCALFLLISCSPQEKAPQTDQSLGANSPCGQLRYWPDASGNFIAPPDADAAMRTMFAVKRSRAALNHVAVAAEKFCVDTGRYPRSLSELWAAGDKLARGHPCALASPGPVSDEWGNEYEYEFVDSVPRIQSAGPDGEFGTSDDVRIPTTDTEGTERFDAQERCDIEP